MGKYGPYDNKENDDYLLDNSEKMIEILNRIAKDLDLISWTIPAFFILITILILVVE